MAGCLRAHKRTPPLNQKQSWCTESDERAIKSLRSLIPLGSELGLESKTRVAIEAHSNKAVLGRTTTLLLPQASELKREIWASGLFGLGRSKVAKGTPFGECHRRSMAVLLWWF